MRTFAFALLIAVMPLSALGEVHVAIDGNDNNDGSKSKPVATLLRAVEIADALGGEQTIVLRKGIYREAVMLAARKDAPPMTITAARNTDGSFERVAFDQSYTTEGAEAVEGMPGVYRLPLPEAYNAYQSNVSMWEADTRQRYREMADVRAVAAFPGSYRFEPTNYFSNEGFLYFHTSDGGSPSSHEIGFSLGDGRFEIARDHVTLRGLHFQNSVGVGVRGTNVVVEDCSAWNIKRMVIYISSLSKKATVRRLTATDVGSGVYSEGAHTIVEDCRLFRTHDSFESHARSQQDSAGIQLYYPAGTGEIRGNLTSGFRTGVFCKANQGAVTIERNTCYGGEGGAESTGITITKWRDGSIVRNNIVSGHADAYHVSGFTNIQQGCIFRNNLLWDLKRQENILECFTVPMAGGSGQGVLFADPRFASPSQGDFRLLPDSPALRSGGNQIGAFKRVPDSWQDNAAPTVNVTLQEPATILGRTVEHYWELDHWQEGGGVREQRETTFEQEAGNQWLAASRDITLKLAALDNASDVTQMKVRIGTEPWSKPRPFAPTCSIELPEESVDTKVAVSVADSAGNWSETAEVRIFRVDAPPQLVGEVSQYMTRYGMVLAMRTNVPCFARLVWGEGDSLEKVAERTPDVFRQWDAGDGGEWTEIRTGPRRDHILAIASPEVEAGATFRYQIVLDDGVGNVNTLPAQSVTLAGEPREIVLDPTGKDQEQSAGPWATLQFAADRALPGDRIVLRDGLYTGVTTLRRGGVEGAPIVIEAENKWKATLDVGKMHRRVIQMNETPWVTLRGLEIRWFQIGGMHITDSEYVTLESLRIWNEHLAKGRRSGTGFYARRSPNLTIRKTLLFYMNNGFTMLDSPGFHFEQITVGPQLHRGSRIICSTRDSTLINSCFAFTGNDHIQAYERREDWETFTCDYNNYPAIVRDRAPRRPAPDVDITRWSGSHWARQSKGVNDIWFRKTNGPGFERNHCFSLAEWQAVSGKDANSIFKRPLFVNPHENDWRLQPDSPNIGAGADGKTIGATSPITPQAQD